MKTEMFEYKTENNWFIGKATTDTSVHHFDEMIEFSWAEDLINRLTPEKFGLKIEIFKLSAKVELLDFILMAINDSLNRRLSLTQGAGVLIVSEGSRIFWLDIVQGGILRTDLLNNLAENESISHLPNKLLIATHNLGKAKEFKNLFEAKGVHIETLADYPDLPVVEEVGLTFEENARLKAETIANLTGLPVLADDSGLMVEALGGRPGVFSARFAGEHATAARNNAKLLHELSAQPTENRSAKFHATLALAHPARETLLVSADWSGYIAKIPKGENGFGYDPLFLVGDTGKTSAELTEAEKNQISHRAKALWKLSEVWEAWWKS
ncbi:MAG: nucleoside-triphosphate diphosphatase [Streptococcaceae bacterium]|jgi:XTP/dITP diphosphohydrolase|nr:nucleoside-triphosphate diphosphatase [Streptococcaceae bacterium]